MPTRTKHAPKPQKRTKPKKPPLFKRPEKIVDINAEEYIKPKKGTWKNVLTAVLWCMIGFVFVRGVMAMLRPDPLAAMQQSQARFIQAQTERMNLEDEVQSFAQNFAREYLTYKSGIREDYQQRVQPFVSTQVTFSDSQSFQSDAEALYVQAYKLEAYDDAQYDVYVMADVEYTSMGAAVEGVRQVLTETSKTYLKVPVRVLAKGRYVVVDYPVFVAEPDSSAYAGTQFAGREVDKPVNDQIAQVLSNFFAAYYEENQTRIEYFLSTTADKAQFKGLGGRYDFREIRSVRSYADPADGRRILAVVELRIADVNGQALTQRYNMLVTHDGTRYYVVEMDTRTVDISKYNFNVQ